MNTPLYKRYETRKPCGSMALCNTCGIAIYEPDEFDKYDCDFVAAWVTLESRHGFHRHKVHYTPSGRAYIRKGNLRVYLDEVMRV